MPGSFPQLIWLLLTSYSGQLVVSKISPGKSFSLPPITARSTNLVHKTSDVSMMCYLIQPHSIISGFCSSVPDFAVWLPSLLPLPVTSLPLANASDTTPRIRDLHTCCFAVVESLFVFLNFFKSLQQVCALLMQGAHKNYMSIGVSVRTTKFAARNNLGGVRQEGNPQSPTAFSSVR